MASGLELIRAAAPSRLYAVAGGAVLSVISAILLIRFGCGAFSTDISSPGYALCMVLASLFCCSFGLRATGRILIVHLQRNHVGNTCFDRRGDV